MPGHCHLSQLLNMITMSHVTRHASRIVPSTLISKALGTYALFLQPAHHASALYCQSYKAPQCLLSTDACSTHGPLTKLTRAQ
jgi:hypothetical protein